MTEAVDTKTDNVEGINYDFYADGDMQDTSSANKFNRDRTMYRHFAINNHCTTRFLPVEPRQCRWRRTFQSGECTTWVSALSTHPHKPAAVIISAQVKTFQDVVCGVMGIPKSLMMADTPHKSDEEGTHQTLKKTILTWKNNLQSICEQLYSLIYAEDIKNQLMKAIGKKRKKTRVQDVYALKKKLKVEIVFPIAPFLSHNELYIHYQRGVISWDTYTKHACAHASLPYEKLEEPSQTVESTEPTNVETDFDETEI